VVAVEFEDKKIVVEVEVDITSVVKVHLERGVNRCSANLMINNVGLKTFTLTKFNHK